MIVNTVSVAEILADQAETSSLSLSLDAIVIPAASVASNSQLLVLLTLNHQRTSCIYVAVLCGVLFGTW
jgi:hypothetical protein